MLPCFLNVIRLLTTSLEIHFFLFVFFWVFIFVSNFHREMFCGQSLVSHVRAQAWQTHNCNCLYWPAGSWRFIAEIEILSTLVTSCWQYSSVKAKAPGLLVPFLWKLSLAPCVCVCMCVCIYLSGWLADNFSLLSLSLSFCVCTCLRLSLSVCLSRCLSLSQLTSRHPLTDRWA